MKIIYLLCGAFLLLACNTSNVKVITLQISDSSIPEGIVVDPKTNEIYVSSVHEDRVTKSSFEGTNTEIVLDKKDNGFTIGVGMDIWQDELYALGRFERGPFAILSIKNLHTDSLLTVQLNEEDSTFFNDLAIDQQGNAYITDTDNHNIYYFDKQTGKIERFLTDEQIKYPNGIAISEDQSKLFIDSYTSGIRILDIQSKTILNQKHEPTANLGVDGLKYDKGNLYFIINGGEDSKGHGLYKVNLIQKESELGEMDPLIVNHEKMNLPTTFSIANGHIFVLANSQMANLDQEINEILDPTKLTKTYILTLKINTASN